MSIRPELSSETSDNHRHIRVAGIFGGPPRPHGLDAVVYSEEIDYEKVIEKNPFDPSKTMVKRTIEATLILDPMQMKSTQKWLEGCIREHEKLFGPIPSPEELESKARRDPDQ